MIADLGLTITLRIAESGESMSDLVLREEVGYLLAGKVCFIVRDDGVGESEATHDILPKKLDSLLTRLQRGTTSTDLVKYLVAISRICN